MIDDNKLLNEPEDPSHYWITVSQEEIGGVLGTAKIKKWFDKDNKQCQRVLNFTSKKEVERREEVISPQERSNIEQERDAKVEKSFLEHGLSSNPLVQESQE